MSISSIENNKLLQDNIDRILKEVKDAQTQLYEDMVSYDEVINIFNIIKKYIKENKRKIYGGYALNELIKQKDPSKEIYTYYDKNTFDAENIRDIDIYSPDPIYDFVNICNLLHKAGITFILAHESVHIETYSIKVKDTEYCNISYVPKNIYNKLPYQEIDGYVYIHPQVIMIDMLRIFTSPLNSYWRLKKDIYSRFLLLEQFYPLPIINKPLNNFKHSKLGNKALEVISKYLINRESCILTGFYMYNCYTYVNKLDNYINIPYYEIISFEYRSDVLDLLDVLKATISPDKIKIEEYYPFFQFIDYSANIYIDNELVVKIYNNGKKCTPYIKTVSLVNNEGEILEGNIYIATFQLACLYILINIIKARVNNQDKTPLYILLSKIISLRNLYLKNNNKTVFDKTVFEEFIVHCKGYTISNKLEKKKLIEYRKKSGKRYTIRYDPADKIIKPFNYIFANSSGNIINNKQNLKVQSNAESDSD